MIYVTIQPTHQRKHGVEYRHGHDKHTSHGDLNADVDENEPREKMYVLQR